MWLFVDRRAAERWWAGRARRRGRRGRGRGRAAAAGAGAPCARRWRARPSPSTRRKSPVSIYLDSAIARRSGSATSPYKELIITTQLVTKYRKRTLSFFRALPWKKNILSQIEGRRVPRSGTNEMFRCGKEDGERKYALCCPHSLRPLSAENTYSRDSYQ